MPKPPASPLTTNAHLSEARTMIRRLTKGYTQSLFSRSVTPGLMSTAVQNYVFGDNFDTALARRQLDSGLNVSRSLAPDLDGDRLTL